MDNSFSKEQLITIHSLGAKAAEELELDTPRHDEVGASPIQIHKTNEEHMEGMMAVFRDIDEELEDKKS